MSNLTPVIKSIQDVMRQDAGVDGDAQRISQLTWLLFLKVFDALEEELELTRDAYKSPIPEHLRWRNWAADPEGMTGDELLDFVNNTALPQAQGPPADPVRNPRGYVVRGVFEDAYNYMKSGQLLRQVINKLNAIDFNRQAERHQFNDLYEKILATCKAPATRASSTPRAPSPSSWWTWSTRSSAKGARPGLRHRRLPGLRHRTPAQAGEETEDEALLQASIRGVEKKQLPHLLCVTNLLLHGIEVPSQRSATTTPWPARCATTAPPTAWTSC
jgi:type I restriction enzyme M protein